MKTSPRPRRPARPAPLLAFTHWHVAEAAGGGYTIRATGGGPAHLQLRRTATAGDALAAIVEAAVRWRLWRDPAALAELPLVALGALALSTSKGTNP